MESLSELPVMDLLSRCATSGNLSAWEEFAQRYQRLIARVVFRVSTRFGDSSQSLVDDLVQETYLKLCGDNFRLLRGFVEQHPNAFFGYIKVIAANVVRDHFKSKNAGKRSGSTVSVDYEAAGAKVREFDSGSAASIEKRVLLQEIDSQVRACSEGPDQERNTRIFWLYYRVGLTAAAIATLPEIGLNEKGVESTILRMTRAVRGRIGPSPPARLSTTRTEGILPAESL